MGYIERLEDAIRQMHGLTAVHSSSVPVVEKAHGKIIWHGDVEVFRVSGHPIADICYAWAFKGTDKKEHFKVFLNIAPITSPEAAVKAAIRAQ